MISYLIRVSFSLFLCVLLDSCALTGPKKSAARVVSYNIRYHNPDDGVNAWSKRKEAFSELLGEYDPDILGVQEALSDQMEDLQAALPGHGVLGTGRDDGKDGGEYCGIFFRQSKYNLIDQGQFWLSDTPDVIASVGWDAALTRIATWAILQDKSSGAKIFVLNGHFDHRGVLARTNSARLIMEKTAELSDGVPIVILGDFNSMPDSDAFNNFVGAQVSPKVRDGFEVCSARDGYEGTFQGFDLRSDSKRRIDYIFLSDDLDCSSYSVPGDLIDNARYYSDHLPVIADLTY